MRNQYSMLLSKAVLLSTLMISTLASADGMPLRGSPPPMNECLMKKLGKPEEGKARPSKEDFEKAKKFCDENNLNEENAATSEARAQAVVEKIKADEPREETKTEAAICETCKVTPVGKSTPEKLFSQTQDILEQAQVADKKDLAKKLEKKKDQLIEKISDKECSMDEKPDLNKKILKQFVGHKEMLEEIKEALENKQKDCRREAQRSAPVGPQNVQNQQNPQILQSPNQNTSGSASSVMLQSAYQQMQQQMQQLQQWQTQLQMQQQLQQMSSQSNLGISSLGSTGLTPLSGLTGNSGFYSTGSLYPASSLYPATGVYPAAGLYPSTSYSSSLGLTPIHSLNGTTSSSLTPIAALNGSIGFNNGYRMPPRPGSNFNRSWR